MIDIETSGFHQSIDGQVHVCLIILGGGGGGVEALYCGPIHMGLSIIISNLIVML